MGNANQDGQNKKKCPQCEREEGHSGDCIVPLLELLINVAQILDVVKQEWGESWSAWDQEQRDRITQFISWYAPAPQKERP